MYEAIIGSVITGGLTLAGVIYSSNKTADKTVEKVQNQLNISQAVTNTKIEELTREVREHNNFAKRVPLVEQKIEYIEKDISNLKNSDKNNSN